MEILFQGKSGTIEYFPDDTIEIVRQKIGIRLGIHPNNLFILINLELPQDYYQKDPRRLESLFHRVSYDGNRASAEIFETYADEYVQPKLEMKIPKDGLSRSEWMHYEPFMTRLFPETETRIFGVEEQLSYILPVENPSLKKTIDATKYPIPNNSLLFSTLYSKFIVRRFIAVQYTKQFETVQPIYFPLFRSDKEALTEDIIRFNEKNTRLLNTLSQLDVEEPVGVSVLRTRFFVQWVDTDFGSAIRSKFEQIFYGMTVSQLTPYIGFFTSTDELSRHKFYVDKPGSKTPLLDISLWSRWWALSKPSRNKPTLILYRGKSKNDFDRIAITSTDAVFSTYRPEKNTETIEELRLSMLEWFMSLDGIVPFVDQKDIESERWDLQDMNLSIHYATPLDSFDLRRFECLSSIYNIADKKKSQFGLLRTDKVESGLSAIEVKIILMLNDGPINAKKLSEELSISIADSNQLINDVMKKIDEDPRLRQRAFRKFPSMTVGSNSVTFSSINNIDFAVKYSNILRYILANPETTELDEICPRRVEEVKVAKIESLVEATDEDVAEYGDFFDEGEEQSETQSLIEEQGTEEIKRIKTAQKQGTIYSYFKLRLQQFDPITFHATATKYPKKCEQKHQPIIMSESDLIRLRDTPYNPKSEGFDREKVLDIEEPDGSIICPEYWCIRDEIPLRRDQLIDDKGVLKCPKCKGKLETKSSDDLNEFPLRKRESGFNYPGYTKYRSPKNDKEMPCCFKRKHSEKLTESVNKFYILGVGKWETDEDRVGFISPEMLRSLFIKEDYLHFDKNVIVNDRSGIFRVNSIKISDFLPKLVGVDNKILSPRKNIKNTIRCSFFSSWTSLSDKHLDEILKELEKFPEFAGNREIARIISGIDESFETDDLTPIQELEYSAISIQCDIFRIFVDDFSLGCFFYTDVGIPKKRAIIVLQKGESINFISNVTRNANKLNYQGNIYKAPFESELHKLLESAKKKTCKTEVPSMEEVLSNLPAVMASFESENFKYILDPFGQAQAIYLDKDNIIIPFQSTFIAESEMESIRGYSNIPEFPSLANTKKLLEQLSQKIPGFAFKENLYNKDGQVSELITTSGLRIAIQPVDDGVGENQEVISTVRNESEDTLVFGEPLEELKTTQREISYSSEIYEFLIFQLSKDLTGNDNDSLKDKLEELKPSRSKVEPLLQEWFDNMTTFMKIDKPIEFLSKVRQPCGQLTQDKCTGNLCGWDGVSCKIKIRNSLKKDVLFNKLLTTLIENSKIRAIVLDGRSSPFFSTVLYQDLPTEVIMTDSDLPI